MAELPPIPHRDLIREQFFVHDGRSVAVPPSANPALVFDRYLPVWEEDRKSWKVDTKTESLSDFASACRDAAATDRIEWLEHIHHRLDSLLQIGEEAGAPVGRIELTTTSRLAIGLGADHPVENNMTLDYSIGVPMIPGSAVKGLCRAWCSIQEVPERVVERYFGAQPESGHAASGAWVFLPAYPLPGGDTSAQLLEVDIINPHYPTYYRSLANPRPKAALPGPDPADSPIPIQFLAVPRGVPFVFRILPRTPDVAASIPDACLVLEAALAELGIGAKTAIGYGLFSTTVSDDEVRTLLERWSEANDGPQ